MTTMNDRLRSGDATIEELIENLRRFPQTARVRIRRNMVSIRAQGKNPAKFLYFLDDTIDDDEWTTSPD